MSEPTLEIDVHDGLAHIRFNRPRQRNACTSDMMAALDDALDSLAEDSNCRVIVIRGNGGHFCAGWDFNELSKLRGQGKQALKDQFAANLGLLEKIERHPKIVVSVVEGSVMGFGFSLVVRSDIALAADSCRFALPEIALGIVPAIVMTDVRRTVPPKFALDWLLSGRTLDPGEALQAGLVSRVFPQAEFEQGVGSDLERIAGYSASVLGHAKQLHRQLGDLPGSEGEQLTIDAAIEALNSPSAAEGIAAMQEKRRPRWPD